MYERFTNRAKKVMNIANRDSQRLNHEHLGTEHILLGLIDEGTGVAAHVLKKFDLSSRRIRQEIKKNVQTVSEIVSMDKPPQTSHAKKVIENAMVEAQHLKHNYVGTEHLLLGLLREEDSLAVKVLQDLGLNIEETRNEVLKILGHGPYTEEDDGVV